MESDAEAAEESSYKNRVVPYVQSPSYIYFGPVFPPFCLPILFKAFSMPGYPSNPMHS